MKNLSFKLILAFALLLSASVSIALPACKGSYSAQWTGCIGTVTLEEVGEYVGEFVNGNFNGQGTLTWSDGDVYEGNWVDDDMTGYGTYTYPGDSKYVGFVYVGEHKDDEFNGQGIRTFADGTVEEGIFFEDEFISERKISSSKTQSDFQITAITDIPSSEDILDAIYKGQALRKLFSINIMTMDGFFETKNIYTAQVKYSMKEKNVFDALRELYFRDYLIEQGFTKSEATFYTNSTFALNSLTETMLSAFGGGINDGNVNQDNSRVVTEIFRFGKGNNGWIYIPEQASVSDSSDSYYETDFSGWVDNYATF